MKNKSMILSAAAKNKNFTENAIKGKAYKKFDGELKEKKNFGDSSRIKNEEAVTYLQQRGIINGYDDGTFGPENSVNRAEATKIILEALGLDIENIDSTEFADVDANAWYAKYLQYAKDNNLIDADENGNINPSQSMTRDEFSEVVYRLLQQQEAL